jgi:hypothetical protein
MSATTWSAIDLAQLERIADHMEITWALIPKGIIHRDEIERLNVLGARALREFVRAKRAEGIAPVMPPPLMIESDAQREKVDARVAARKPRPAHPKPVFRGAQ